MSVAMRLEVYVGGLPITGIACSNPAEDSNVCFLSLLGVVWVAVLRWAHHSFRGVLSSLFVCVRVRACVRACVCVCVCVV
jgi:hypothetical protein